ncbi:CvpA family protein [Sphingomonas sp. LY54]|uniref:CvpA family protein n=1 Tax=Sphingomonas sp. LY54 TaxID=3095343 RepID=UPI002D77CACA|nr:CvpA family protein [Sphingomonas sp. LY54]WRP28508.1 CvpA family protein [Sphingomonas sp. LY54]
MAGLTAFDIIVLLLVGGGLFFGFLRGFVGEVLSLGAWVAAIVALKFFHGPVSAGLEGPVGTPSGASVLAFALIFGIVFVAGKLIAGRIGGATRSSVIGPVDRVLGAGFGALKGLIGATLLYLAANLVYDTIWGKASERPQWMATSRTYPLLNASGRAIVDFVEARREREPDEVIGENKASSR